MTGNAGKYAEERYTRHDSTTKYSEGFNFRPFTAQEWYGENKSVLEEYETPPPYIPMEEYNSLTSGTAKLFNGDEAIMALLALLAVSISFLDFTGRISITASEVFYNIDLMILIIFSADYFIPNTKF